MTRKLNDVPIEQLMVEHYFFDLGYPIEKVSEISEMDEETVREDLRLIQEMRSSEGSIK